MEYSTLQPQWWVAAALEVGCAEVWHPTGPPRLVKMYAGGSDQINVSIFVSHLVATYDPKALMSKNEISRNQGHKIIKRCKGSTFWDKHQRLSEHILSSVWSSLISRWCLKTRWDPQQGQLVRRWAKHVRFDRIWSASLWQTVDSLKEKLHELGKQCRSMAPI